MSDNPAMIQFEDIEKRLAVIGKDRAWLAKESKRSPGSIRSALAPNAHIKQRSSLLQKALTDAIEREEATQSGATSTQSRTPPGYSEIFLTNEEYDIADKASRLVNSPTMAAFCRDAIQAEAQRIIERSAIASHPSHWIDLCGGIAAGSPISSDAPHEPIPVANAYPTDCYALRVFGHSMEPKIADGSTIVVQRLAAGNHPKQGKFVVYSDAYGLSLKKLAYRKAKAGEEANSLGKVAILESTNPDFPEVQTMDGGRIEAVFVASISPENILAPITLVPDSKIPSVEKQA